jgi:D-alanyl-D-alanine-carboxypeptidase/D-alanyl-D-alanine-endopeptidase
MKNLLSLWLALMPLCSWAQSLEELTKQRVDYKETPGIAVAIIEDGKSIFLSYGQSNLSTHDPVTSKTLFEIGSITQTFTCSVLSYLVQKKELALSDPAQKHLPSAISLPEKNGKSITLLHLATQHSGLPRMPGNFSPADQLNPFIDYTEKELTAYLNNCELKNEPGTTYEYSNLGMGLLGFILTQEKNKPYSELIKEVILSPLGMSQTSISGLGNNKLLATGYRDTSPMKAWTWNNQSVLAAAGGLVSNAEDMLKFVNAQMNSDNTTLGTAFKETHKEQNDAGSPTMQIGLGWHIREHKYIWHNGATAGFHSFIGFDPIKKRGIVILTNSTIGADDLGFHWLDDSVRLKVIKKPMSLEPSVLKEYEGVYEINPTFKITITAKGKDIFLQATSQPQLSIYAEEPDKFFLKVVEATVHFKRGANNRIEKLTLYQNGATLEGKRIN